MKFMKHILMVALFAAMVPCGHADMHHGHCHDADVELCGIAEEPCACHSCEHQPCADKIKIPLDHSIGAIVIERPSTSVLCFIPPETKPVLRQSLPPVPGILASIQTVQLLI
ncbi:MAG: hypothetical protein ABFR47_04595 [Verrucomicrobiota bacterium]